MPVSAMMKLHVDKLVLAGDMLGVCYEMEFTTACLDISAMSTCSTGKWWAFSPCRAFGKDQSTAACQALQNPQSFRAAGGGMILQSFKMFDLSAAVCYEFIRKYFKFYFSEAFYGRQQGY